MLLSGCSNINVDNQDCGNGWISMSAPKHIFFDALRIRPYLCKKRFNNGWLIYSQKQTLFIADKENSYFY
jgi:hypothetical protein